MWGLVFLPSDTVATGLISGNGMKTNSWGRQWGNSITNRQGEDLEDALVMTDLLCINNGSVTRLASQPGDSGNIIDLALVTSSVASK